MWNERATDRTTRIVLVALFIASMGFVSGSVLARRDTDAALQVGEFPSGRFEHVHYPNVVVEFDDDGAFRYFEHDLETPLLWGTFGARGDVFVGLARDAGGETTSMALAWTADDGRVTFDGRARDEVDRHCRVFAGQTFLEDDGSVHVPSHHVESGDHTIAVHRGTPHLVGLVEFAVGRFGLAGLAPPAVGSIAFTTGGGLCDGELRGRCRPGPDGAEVIVCGDERDVCLDRRCSSYRPVARRLLLHELAHAWIDENVTPDVQIRFAEHAGVSVWADERVAWDRRGVEVAADTIAWGLLDFDVFWIGIGKVDPPFLSEGFRILTGHEPLRKTTDLGIESVPPANS